MKKKKLLRPVTITGTGFWGGASGFWEFPRRQASITFRPFNLPGWYWKTKYGNIPINLSIATMGMGEITLRYKDAELHVWEHIGSLRFLGIDGILIESTPWPPYHGRAWELYDELKSSLIESDKECTCIYPKNAVFHEIRNRNGVRSTSIVPPLYDNLEISNSCQWGKLPDYRNDFKVTEEYVEACIKICAQGFPKWRHPIAKIAHRLGLYPHMDKAVWPGKNAPSTTALWFGMHRNADLLGALSLAHHEHLLHAKIVTDHGGHAIDLAALRKTKWKQ